MCAQSQCSRWVVAMKSYFDGSGKSRDGFIVLTAVAALDHVWKRFIVDWATMLSQAERRPSAEFLHTVDLLTGADPFTPNNGWDKPQRWQLMWDCVMYAQHLDKTDFKVFTCTVDMAAHRELTSNGVRLPNPYAICCRFCSERVLYWYQQAFEKNFRTDPKIQMLFDRGERHKGVFERRWVANKKLGRGLSNPWHLIDEVATVFAEDTPPIQLADLISWCHHRRLNFESTKDPKYHHGSDFWKVLEGVLPFRRAEVNREMLAQLALYSEAMPDRVIEEFGQFEKLSD
jgi:hypothetical protein